MNVMDFDPCSPESTADESHEVSWQGEKFLAEPGADFHHHQCKIWWRKLWSFNTRHFLMLPDYINYEKRIGLATHWRSNPWC